MEQNYNDNNNNQDNYGQSKPNGQEFAITCLVCGIVSIVLCWCYGIIGLACGIVAIVMRNKFRELNGGYVNGMVKAGFICACVGVSLSALSMIFYILIYVGILGRYNTLSYFL